MTTTLTRLAAYRGQLPVRWTTIAVFALALAYGDGFWLTALQGAIGAIERTEPPFVHWLRQATLMLPLVVFAVLAALLVTRRRVTRRPSTLVEFGATALLIALFSGGVGITVVAVSSLRDYQFQVQHLELLHSYGVVPPLSVAGVAGFGPATRLPYSLYCDLRGVAVGSAVSLLEYATLMVHVRALMLSALVLLSSNLVLASGLLALLRGRLWATRGVASPTGNEPSGQFVADGAMR